MSTIIPTALGGDLNTELFSFLKTQCIEGFEPFVYSDSRNIPTLGVGYALVAGYAARRAEADRYSANWWLLFGGIPISFRLTDLVFILLLTCSSSAVSAAYQSHNINDYRVPHKLTCSGLNEFPKGIRIDIPKPSAIGNLEDGLQYLYPSGKTAIYIFQFFGQGGSKKLEFSAIRIDLINWQREEYKGVCQVSLWHSISKQ